MIIEKFDENKIVFAYNEWNKKDVDDDNYYVIAYLELYPTRLVLKYRSAKISGDNRWGCVGNFEEDDEHKKIVFTVGRCIDNIDSNLYYSDHVIMDFVAKKIARYDMVCMPFKKRIWMDTAEAIRVKHIAKCSHKKFCKVYANTIEIANDLCRMDKYEKAFFSVGGKANYENFVSRNNDVVPDFYLGKDILKYRAASLAFMNVAGNHSQNKIKISCPIGESHTRIIMPTKWNWREHMVINVDHISSGTNRFLDRYPGCVPLNMKLAFNTSREPSRLFLIAQDVVRLH